MTQNIERLVERLSRFPKRTRRYMYRKQLSSIGKQAANLHRIIWPQDFTK